MSLNIFLFFPETDNQILNDISKQSVLDFFKISKLIKNESNINFFYDEKNIDLFIKKNKISEIYLENIINQLRIKLNKKGAINIQTKNIIDKNCFYFQWNFNECRVDYCFEILKEIAERKVQFDLEQCILINLNNSIGHCRERILVFKDAKHIVEYPVNFIHIEFVSNFLEFDYWLKTKHIISFSLFDKNRFRKHSDKIMKGAIVYFEFNEDRYWHKDTFHNYIEYEIYDGNGDHLATADENGKINYTAKDTDKENVLGK